MSTKVGEQRSMPGVSKNEGEVGRGWGKKNSLPVLFPTCKFFFCTPSQFNSLCVSFWKRLLCRLSKYIGLPKNDCAGESHLFEGLAVIFILTTYVICSILSDSHVLIIAERTAVRLLLKTFIILQSFYISLKV